MILYRADSVCGAGVHYQGWPAIVKALQTLATDQAPLLDDFADGSYSYHSIPKPRSEPWCGIFHHPVNVSSPLPSDRKHELKNAWTHPFWTPPSRAVAMTEEGAAFLQQHLNIPTITILHGIDSATSRWHLNHSNKLVQIGSTLRNTRAIYDFPCSGYQRCYLRSRAEWSLERDRRLRAFGEDVDEIDWLSSGDYDSLLCSCVVFAEYFGVAASNLVIECMVRGTPILLNRLPAIEEYVGCDYPLFFDCCWLSDSALRAASEHLLARAKLLPSVNDFAEQVRAFVHQDSASEGSLLGQQQTGAV